MHFDINVVGMGYIGLPTAIMMSKTYKVCGTDLDEALIKDLQENKRKPAELGMEEALSEAVENGLAFSTEVQDADFYIVAVPTPYCKETKKIDSAILISAVEGVLKVCAPESVIIIESTVSPGTLDKNIRPLIDKEKAENGKTVYIAHAPERIIPGNMLKELVENDRTIGVDYPEIGEKIREIYASFCTGDIIVTDIKTAELSKVVENTFRDINIAFANELAKICDEEGIDVYEVIDIANRHPRVNILKPGPGVGGHCIAVDPWFLVGDYPLVTNLIKQGRITNESMPNYVLEKIRKIAAERNIASDRIGIYGLTYKENVDDTRESPTLQMLEYMTDEEKENMLIYDPLAHLSGCNQIESFDEFMDKSDMVVIMVGHHHILENQERLKGKTVFDTRNILTIPDVIKL